MNDSEGAHIADTAADFRDDFLDVLVFRNVPESLPNGLSRLDLAEALARIVIAHIDGSPDA